MSGIKQIISAPIKKRNRQLIGKIDTILFELAEIFDTDDMSLRFDKERELVDIMSRLSKLSKKENSALLQPLHLYFTIMFHEGRLAIDSTVDSDSVALFTDFFMNNRDKVLSVFYKADLQKVIMTLITMNLSIHCVQRAAEVRKAYYDIFDQTYLARMLYRLSVVSCGTIEKECISDLYENVPRTYEECKTLSSKADFLYNVFLIDRNTGWKCECLDGLIRDLSQRIQKVYYSGFILMYKTFMQFGDYVDLADEWIDSLDMSRRSDKDKEALRELEILCEDRKAGRDVSYAPKFRMPEDKERLSWRFDKALYDLRNRNYARSKLKADMEDALEYYKTKCMEIKDTEQKLKCKGYYCSLKNQLAPVSFWSDFETNYRKVADASGETRKDIRFFFVNEYSLVNGSLAFPVMMAARKNGIGTWCTSPNVSPEPFSPDDPFDELVGYISGDNDNRTVQFNAVDYGSVDIENKRIMVHGMNVYQPIFEFVTRYQFTYDYNYDTDAWARSRTHFLMRTFDRLFTYIEKIEQVAAETGTKVYFLSNAPHIHNAAAFRIYCEEKGYKNGLEYICVSPGYDNYFANAKDPKAATITVLNLTKNPGARNSFLGTDKGYEAYYEKNLGRIGEVREKMDKHLKAQRGRDMQAVLSDEKNRIIGLLEKAKADGRKVIVLNGKVIIDLAVKYTKGCVHSDMSEWITHAVRFAGSHPDEILLLIKPHPHENRSDLTLTSEKIDDLRSLIKCELSENTIYLDNDMFRISELVPYMDLGMVWNGTSSVEFAAQGIKTLIADEWGFLDYPIGFVRAETLEEYESYMLDPDKMQVRDDLADRAIVFLEYMGSEDVRVINPYSSTSAMNFHQYKSKINSSAVDDYIKNGDEALDMKVREIL